MTALNQYQRLECPGLWRETPETQRREVIVTFGDATLILRESPSERALTHWSLPALIRTNPGMMPALFKPGPESAEELEIDDETMIAAIAKVHTIIAARRPRPGRLRGALMLSVALATAAVALLWLPGAMITHTASVLPETTRGEVGKAILEDLKRLTGTPCVGTDGSPALQELSDHLGIGTLVVLPEGLKTALHLPGGIIAVGRPLVEDHDSPEVVAGFILAELLRAESSNPLREALAYAGLRATFGLLTTGQVPGQALYGYGEQILTRAPAAVSDAALLKRFETAGVGSSAYAYALDETGQTTQGLIAADPFAQDPPPFPLLNDTDWVALQGICSS